MSLIKRLSSDQRGATVIEMAMVAPFLATLLIGMVDLSRGYSAKLQLEQAAQRAIEKVMQGNKTTTVYATLQAEGAAAAGVLPTAVEVDYWLECNGTRQSSYDSNCPSGQSYARYLAVTITKKYKPMFSTRFAGAEADGNYTLVGKSGIRVQ